MVAASQSILCHSVVTERAQQLNSRSGHYCAHSGVALVLWPEVGSHFERALERSHVSHISRAAILARHTVHYTFLFIWWNLAFQAMKQNSLPWPATLGELEALGE